MIGRIAIGLIVTAPACNVKAQNSRAPLAVAPSAPRPLAVGPRAPISLAEAVFIGLRDNRTVKSAYIARVSEKFDLFVAQTRFRPTALLTASDQATWQGGGGSSSSINPSVSWLAPTGAQFQFGWSRLETRGSGQSTRSELASLTFSQPLLRGGGLAVNAAPIRIAELQERVNRLTLKSTVANTVTSIVTAYRTLLQAQAQLVIAQQSLDRSNVQLETNQALIDAGRMAAAEIIQTKADIADQQVALLQAEQQLDSAQLALLALLAMDLHTNIVAADPIKAEHLSVDVDQAIAIALDNRPDYLSQRLAVEQARQNLIVARNARLWNLSVVGDVQHQTQHGSASVAVNSTTGGGPSTTGAIGLQLSIPLGDYTLQQGEVQATTTLRTAELQLEDLHEQVEAQVRDAVQGVELSWRQVEAARRARDLAAETLAMEQEKLKAGRASNFEVLSFEANLRTADSQALSASIGYLNALTGLDQQLGATLDTWKIDLND
ncbi:MAG: TolC family protein [Caulobacteraceae bacterium]|nr:TolC family protein [Caulobacteraceae bacterium]